jgi:dimethylargininase
MTIHPPTTRTAITRQISPSIGQCELTHLERQPIDLERAYQQHQQYEQALVAAGCRVIQLPAEPELPDAVFVEDTAVVLDEVAIITRPGALSRRAETASVAAALSPYRSLQYIQPPAVIYGGDVLRINRTVYIGLTERTSQDAVEQFLAILQPYGYSVHGVPVRGCLHLKSAVTQAASGTLLINPSWVDPEHFPGMHLIDVHPDEPYAANSLLIEERLIYPEAYPRTLQRLQEAGIAVHVVPASELAKAEGALTCCSLIFRK